MNYNLIYNVKPEIPENNDRELFPLITEDRIVTGFAERKFCHSGAKPLHPVVHLHIYNNNGDLYLQKRSMNKDIQPGKWDTAVGGHVDYGEQIDEALCREAREELGLDIAGPEFMFSYIFESEIEREMVNSFRIIYEGVITPDLDEVTEGRFWTKAEIAESLGKNIFTPNFELEYKKILALEL